MSTGISQPDTSRYVIICRGNKPEQKYHCDGCRKHMKCREGAAINHQYSHTERMERAALCGSASHEHAGGGGKHGAKMVKAPAVGLCVCAR